MYPSCRNGCPRANLEREMCVRRGNVPHTGNNKHAVSWPALLAGQIISLQPRLYMSAAIALSKDMSWPTNKDRENGRTSRPTGDVAYSSHTTVLSATLPPKPTNFSLPPISFREHKLILWVRRLSRISS